MKALKQLAGGMIPALFLTLFASPGQAGYAEDVLGLGPSLYYRLDETDIKPSGPDSGSVVRNLATDGLLFNAAYATQGGSVTRTTGPAHGAISGNAGIEVTGWSVHGTGVTAAGTTPFSLNFWVKPERFEEGEYPCLFHAGNSIVGGPVAEPIPTVHGYAPHSEVGGENNLLIGLDGIAGSAGKVVLATYGIRYCASQAALKAGEWNAVGLTYDGTQLRLYLNGEPDVVFDVSGRHFSSGNGKFLLLGNEYVTGKFPFTGGLDDFAYWNGTVMSDAQMRRLGTAERPSPEAAAPIAGESVMDLNGTWQFRMDPKNEGEAGAWFGAETNYPDTIKVPGNWQAQGFGEPSGITKHNYLGRAWYRRSISVPEDWKNRRVLLRMEGVVNYGEVWLNGRKLGRVRTFVTPYEFDVTGDLKIGVENTLAVMADSQHPPELSYIGMMQFMNRFGGINSHVKLIALADPTIREVTFTPDLANKTVRVGLGLDRKENAAAWQGGVRVKIQPAGGDKSHDVRGDVSFSAGSMAGDVKGLEVSIPVLHAWSPEDPFLYDVKIGLYDGDQLLVEKSVRTGFREIKADADGDILLNGQKYYILGCGYDSLEPVYGTPPPDKAVYKERLQHLKDLGFNAVRFLSHTPLKEFFDAADEVGMLVQAEGEWFMAYSPMPPAVGALFSDLVPRIIKEHGSHPSWYAFSCFNEAYDLNTDPVKRAYVDAAYRTMRGLRPDLLFMPSDGVGDAWPTDVITQPTEIRNAIKLLDGTAQSASSPPQQVFTGGIESVAFFKHALTDENMKALAAAGDAAAYDAEVARLKPSGWWKLNETKPGIVHDASGNGQDGKHEVGPDVADLITDGRFGSGLNSGPETGVSLADVAGECFPASHEPFSASFWVRPESFGAGNFGTFLSWGAASANRALMISLDGEGGTGNVLVGRHSNNILKSKSQLAPGIWSQVGVTYDGRLLKLFIDGKPEGEVAQELAIEPRDARIGRLVQASLRPVEDYRKPFLWHEYNNTYIAPLPDLEIEKKMTGAMTQTAVVEHHRQRMENYGLLPRYPELRQQSFKLYREYVKQAFEELRHMPRVDGFAWWVVSDITAGVETDVSSLAVLDMVYKPEKFTDTAWFRQFNGQSVLIMDADIDARVLRSSEAKPVKISLSHFGAPPLQNGRLEWKLTSAGKTLQQGTVTDIRAATGSVTEIACLELGPLDIPDAAAVRLEVTFDSTAGPLSNSWKFWAFPDRKPGLTSAEILNLTGNTALDARYGSSPTLALGEAALVFATAPTEELLHYIEQGGKVIFLESDAGRAAPLLQAVKYPSAPPPPEHSSFLRKPGAVTYWASWIRCNAQLIEDHPMLAGFPHEGFTDFQLARLFGESVPSVSYTSKDSVARGKVRPVIWNLNLTSWDEDPTPWGVALTWNGLLSEARMGKGHMVLCNLWALDGVARGLPEAGYLLDCLVDYTLSDKFVPDDLPALTGEEARKLFLIENLPVKQP